MDRQTLTKALTTIIVGGLGIFVSLRIWQLLRRRKVYNVYKRKKEVFIVESSKEWNDFYNNHISNNDIKVLGLDCEWVFSGRRHPVSMLQLATQQGSCALVRLCKFSTIPDSLKKILCDRSILKVGVAVKDDGNKLKQDFGISVRGCVDLRHVINRIRGIYKCNSLGLQGLAEGVLDVHLSKVQSVRCGNWEADQLTKDQIDYAANDAIVAVDIFTHLILAKLTGKKPTTSGEKRVMAVEEFEFWKIGRSLCQGTVDVIYNNQLHGSPGRYSKQYRSLVKMLSNQASKNMENQMSVDREEMSSEEYSTGDESEDLEHLPYDVSLKQLQSKDKHRAYVVRKRPLYHSCALMAPDGQMLCICDVRKAAWYIEKGLADKVQDEPLTVKLKFEPAGRPMTSEDYYLQEKMNICVCGKSETHIRKSVIPREYRKYFPPALKSHASHDILLMCVQCHMESTEHDTTLRLHFEKQCDAPIDCGSGLKIRHDEDLRKIRSAARALLNNRGKMPEKRVHDLEDVIKDFYGITVISNDILNKAIDVDDKVFNKDYIPHGKKVVNYMRTNGGLEKFEKMWRKHFIDTMQPEFMPKNWSVDHRHGH